MTDSKLLVHGSCVALRDARDTWAGVLLRGHSGAGKSDLALRLIDGGARLVADDQTEVRAVESELLARAPGTIAGKLEVRGIGILELPYLDDIPLRLVCDLVPPSEVVRHPETETVRLADIEVPRIALAPFEVSAPAKLRLGVQAVCHGIIASPN